MPESGDRIETWFVLPTVRNSDKQTHRSTMWGLLRAELYAVAGGESWKRVMLEELSPTKGGWKNPATGKAVRDTSRKYTMIVEETKAQTVAATTTWSSTRSRPCAYDVLGSANTRAIPSQEVREVMSGA